MRLPPPTEPEPTLPEPQPEPPPSRATRWPIVVALLLAAVWLERRVVSILAAPEPAEQARYFLNEHSHAMLLIAACAAAWPAVRKYNKGKPRRLSFLAVCAAVVLLLNPIFVDIAFRTAGLGAYDANERDLFDTVALVIGLGLTARLRISRSRGALCGGSIASAATLVGLVTVIAVIVAVVALLILLLQISGMNWH